jgi:hypothetical protein
MTKNYNLRLYPGDQHSLRIEFGESLDHIHLNLESCRTLRDALDQHLRELPVYEVSLPKAGR